MKSDRFKIICHFFAGSILLPIAFKMFEYKKFSLCVLLLLFSIFFLFISASLEWLEKQFGNIVKIAFLIESIVFAFVGFYYIEAGNKKYTLIFLCLSVIYILLLLYFLYYKPKKRRKHRKSSSKPIE
jgi:O-antigen/teichoic acid export membrane protein